MSGCVTSSVDLADTALEQVTIIGVTGTNGKTSVTTILASLLTRLGIPAAAIGQRIETPSGVRDRDEVPAGEYGLPNYIRWLATSQGIKVVAVEVYSAALAKDLHKYVNYHAIAFTNITEDHLYVHGTMGAYVAAKLTLFNYMAANAAIFFNPAAEGLHLIAQEASQRGLSYVVPSPCDTPFTLEFQQQNCFLAVTIARHILALPAFRDVHLVINDALIIEKTMQSVSPPGRYERWILPNGVIAVVDFAHNPGGISTVIEHTRAALSSNSKIGFLLSSKGGWGGAKRAAMANAAATADLVVVSDDDPRKEDPALIRAHLANAHGFIQKTPRGHAILQLCKALSEGDVAIIAGRGADNRWQSASGRYFYSDQDVLQRLGGKLLL